MNRLPVVMRFLVGAGRLRRDMMELLDPLVKSGKIGLQDVGDEAVCKRITVS